MCLYIHLKLTQTHTNGGGLTGAGTPFICVYLLGWSVGKRRFGLFIAVAAMLFLWGGFLNESLKNGGANFVEMWAVNLVVFFLAACMFAVRIAKRNPQQVALRSVDVAVALLFETLLANTLTCATLWPVFLASKTGRISLGGGSTLLVAGTTAFAVPICVWYTLQNTVLDRQVAFLDWQVGVTLMQHVRPIRNNVLPARGGNNGVIFSQKEKDDAGALVTAIVRGSRDLRMTGLPVEGLDNLADIIGGGADGAAGLIRFYTRRVEQHHQEFAVLKQFHLGYLSGYDGLGGNTLAAVQGGDSCPWGVVQSHSDGLEHWGRWGAVAKAWDDDSSFLAPFDDISGALGRRHWYALIAAALTVNRDPLSVILAMEQDGDPKMVEYMKTGCEQVLRQVNPEPSFWEGRGLVFVEENDPPTVTYSPAGVWQAENARDAVMLEKETFNMLWWARNARFLGFEEKANLQSKSAELSKLVS